MKKRPDCSSIRDYVSKLLSDPDIIEEIVSNRLLCLTDNNKIKNRPTNGRDSYYIIGEIPVQVEIPPNPSNELFPGPVSYETPLIKDMGKSSSVNPTNENKGDKNNQHEKIENLTIELTALKLFVQEQFYIMKKQLEETIPESTKQDKNVKKKKTENKGGEENKGIKKKDKESKKKDKEEKNKPKGSNSPTEKSKIYILGDSMIKKLNGYFLTKKVRHKYLIKERSFSGAKVSCMVDHVKPTLRDDKPDHIILQAGTNDLRTEKKASQIAKSMT